MSKKVRGCVISACLVIILLFAGGVIPANSVNAADSMTRAEWIHNLTEVFGMTVDADNYPDNYYCDLSAADSCYRDIMVATEFGVIDVEAGKEFQPDAAVTREFAAHTLNYCLGFQREDASYTYSDVEEVPEKYRDDAQTAIDRGWFALVDGAFVPQRAVTTSEISVMINDAKAWLNATEIDQDHDNSFTYEEGYIEVPEETVVELEENDNVNIYDTELDIHDGSKFIIYQNGLPLAFEAKTVSRGNGVLLVSAEQLDNSEAIKTIDAQGVTEGDLGSVIPAEGVEISYEEETEEMPMLRFVPMDFQMQRSMISSRISGNKKVKSIQLSKNIGGNCKVQATLSGLSIEYRINGLNDVYVAVTGDARVVGTGSFSNEGMSTITLGSINVGGIADVTVQAKMLVTGRIEITYDSDFTAGVQYTSGGGFRLTKSFHKKSFTIASEIKMTTGLVASANVDKIPGICGRIYAEIGAKTTISNTSRPGGNPALCTHVLTYMYAEAGASVTIGTGRLSKSFSQNVVIFDAKNSPIRVAYHYEDKVLKAICSVDPNGYYYTGAGSRYGMNSSGYGVGDGGQLVPIFTYTVDDDGNATITGYKGNVSALTIPEELDGHPVIAIGSGAFAKNTSFTSLIIPNTVKKIKNSFSECTSLESVAFPKEFKVEVNGFAQWDRPFIGCNSLTKVSFEKGITKIPNDLFCGCKGLAQIEIPDTVTEIQGGVFSGCSSLRTVILHEGLEVIGSSAFAQCSFLQNITLPSSLEKLYNNAFEACTSLEQINIPKNMVAENVIGGAYRGPFCDCSSLYDIEFEKGITRIPGALFSGCNGLRTVEIPDTVTQVSGFGGSSISEIKIPESVESIEANAFSGCNNLTEVRLPQSLKKLSNNAFENCLALKSVFIPKKFQVTGVIGGAFRGPFYGCKSLIEVSFGEGIQTIPNCLFQGSGLIEITIPNTVTKIEGGAFESCQSLKEASIPDSVIEIDGSVFNQCVALEKVTYSKGLTDIPGGTFKNCSMLNEVELHDKIISIGDSAFENCVSIEEISLSPCLSKIGNSAFLGCTGLTKMEIPASVTWIGYRAFKDCEKLFEVSLKDGLTTIDGSAFANDKALESIRIPDTVESLGTFAFYGCERLSSISVGTGITVIPKSAFENTAVSEIVFPWQVTSIGDKAFSNCVNLMNVTMGCRVSSVAEGAFSYKNKLTIHGKAGTYAETYANDNEIVFNAIDVPVTNVILSEAKCEIGRNQSKRLILKVEPENTTDGVVWSTKNEKIVNVDANGKMTGVSVGMTIVTAKVGSKEVSCEVTVYQPISGIYLNKTSEELYEGDTLQLDADIRPSDATYKDIKWISEQENVAIVDANGLVTAKAEGEATIVAKANNGGKTATCKIKVLKKSSISPDVSPSPIPGSIDTPALKEDSTLSITNDGKLTGLIQNKNSVQEIREQFSDDDLIIKDIDGKILAETDLLGTGATVSIMDGDTVKASCQVVLVGDINGDGKVNGKDVSMLARSLVGKATLVKVQEAAAETLQDGAINGKDVSKLARSLVGKATISSQAK